MALKSVLILGPTGGFGKFIIDELLLRRNEFRRIAAFVDTSRPPTPSKILILKNYSENGVELIDGSLINPLPASFKGFDAVIATLGNHALKYQPSLITAAISGGVSHFYPSEFGADLTVPGNSDERYYRDKVVTRRFLEEKARNNLGFGYTYCLYGRLTEWAPTPHFGIDVRKMEARIVGEPEMRQSLIAVRDAAKYLVCTLLEPPTTQERAFRFLGGNYPWTEIFETLEKVQGGKYEVQYKSVEVARENQRKAIETGDVDAELAASHQVIQGTGRTLLPEPYDNSRFPGVETETLEQTFTRMLEDPSKFPSLGLEGIERCKEED